MHPHIYLFSGDCHIASTFNQDILNWQRSINNYSFDIHYPPCYDITINNYAFCDLFIHTTHL